MSQVYYSNHDYNIMKIINNNKNLSNKQGCKWRIKQQ